jgi:hypothetical protein
MRRSQGGVPLTRKVRARRFELRLPVRYRVNGDSNWSNGTIENISCSGVLFRGEAFAEADTLLELSLVLPDRLIGQRAAQVLCKATVVRSRRLGNGGSQPALAAAISNYRFVRP